MRLSISSVFITLIMVVIMEIFLYFLLKQKKRFLIFRADFIILLGIIILFRLLFPLELPFTHSIYLGSVMNPIQSFFNFEFAPGVNMLELFCSIWVVGICFFGFIYFRKICKRARNFIFLNEPTIMSLLCGYFGITYFIF